MKLSFSLDTFASALAFAGFALAYFFPANSIGLWVSLAALPFMAGQLVRHPHRLAYVILFVVFGLMILLLEWPFPANIAEYWIPLALFACQFRLSLLALPEEREKLNREFSTELESSLPANCLLFIDNDIETITPSRDLHPDHIVRVQAGETLAADGVVSFGSGFTEELTLTGEPEACAKGVGKFVFAGSSSKNSSFLFRVVNAGKSTFLLKKSAALRAGCTKFIFLRKKYLFLEAFALCAVITLHLAVENSSPSLLGVWLCSLGAIFGGAEWALHLSMIRRSAAMGVVWSSLAAIREIGEAKTLVTDPEGTLMEGSLRLSGVACEDGMAEEGALRLAAPLARRIETPAAFSLLKELRMRNIPLELLETYSQAPGGGFGVIAGEEVRLCDEATMRLEQIPYARFDSFLTQEMNRAGASALFLLKELKVISVFTFVESVRTSSAATVSALSRAEISLVLISSARKDSVEALAQEVGAAHVHGEANPGAANSLLSQLHREDLQPIWLDNGIRAVPEGKFPCILTPLAAAPSSSVLTAKWDLVGAWQLIRLARFFLALSRNQFLLTLFLQATLWGICLRWPLVGTIASFLVAAPLLYLPAGKLAAEPLR